VEYLSTEISTKQKEANRKKRELEELEQRPELIKWGREQAKLSGEQYRALLDGKTGLDRLTAQIAHDCEHYWAYTSRPMPVKILSQRYNRQSKKYANSFVELINDLSHSGVFVLLELPKHGKRLLCLAARLDEQGICRNTLEMEVYIERLETEQR